MVMATAMVIWVGVVIITDGVEAITTAGGIIATDRSPATAKC
jgi:hypothetical protein